MLPSHVWYHKKHNFMLYEKTETLMIIALNPTFPLRSGAFIWWVKLSIELFRFYCFFIMNDGVICVYLLLHVPCYVAFGYNCTVQNISYWPLLFIFLPLPLHINCRKNGCDSMRTCGSVNGKKDLQLLLMPV